MQKISQEPYERVIETITRRPMRPVIGHPIFAALFAAAWCARTLLGFEYAGLVVLLLFFLYPYYCVQLLMQWRMRRHQVWARRVGVCPTYVPSSYRIWAGVYIGFFFAVAGGVMWFEKLVGLHH